MLKRCAHCQQEKPLSEFAYHNKILRTYQKHCRDCMREFNKSYYSRRGEEQKERVKVGRSKRQETARQYIWDYLSTHPCVDCGESDPIVLQFDHVSGDKRDAVSNLGKGNHSLEQVKAKIAKCVVRCANCHQRKTHKERGWFSR